jgi:hypothetical protein
MYSLGPLSTNVFVGSSIHQGKPRLLLGLETFWSLLIYANLFLVLFRIRMEEYSFTSTEAKDASTIDSW